MRGRPGSQRLLAARAAPVRLVDELHDTARGGEALWQELRAGWSEAQLIELIALVGFYHLISFTTNALRIPLEPYGARFPAR